MLGFHAGPPQHVYTEKVAQRMPRQVIRPHAPFGVFRRAHVAPGEVRPPPQFAFGERGEQVMTRLRASHQDLHVTGNCRRIDRLPWLLMLREDVLLHYPGNLTNLTAHLDAPPHRVDVAGTQPNQLAPAKTRGGSEASHEPSLRVNYIEAFGQRFNLFGRRDFGGRERFGDSRGGHLLGHSDVLGQRVPRRPAAL